MPKLAGVLLALAMLSTGSAKPYLPAYIRNGAIDKTPLHKRDFELQSGVETSGDGFIGQNSAVVEAGQNEVVVVETIVVTTVVAATQALAASTAAPVAASPAPVIASSAPVIASSAPTAAAVSPNTAGSATAGSAPAAPGSSSYWVSDIKRQGTVAFGAAGYKIYRSVADYGAKGDGKTDDTAAINAAISDGNRCGQGCDSSTVTPAIVFFPAGTYLISAPIVQYYYTQLVGDALNLPVLKAAPAFSGMAVIDADPYTNGVNWYTNTNNFYRQVRNFVIDISGITGKNSAGIHWQVAQGTSLANIRFEMVQGTSTQSGVFMDNGSGGWFEDLIFNGGNYALFLGNQQFTSRNITINNAATGIFMNWNWIWSLKSITFNSCGVGLDMANSPANQTVGSVLLQDSKFVNTPIGVNNSFSADSVPTTGGTLIIDNVDFTGSKVAVQHYTGETLLAGGGVVDSWIAGRTYAASASNRTVGSATAPNKPAGLVDSTGAIFERSRPQYENYPSSSFVSVKTLGAAGDGKTDDTKALQAAIDTLQDNQILYFDHGAYVVSSTISIPGNKNIKITGEIWPLIMATGPFFGNETNPQPVFEIGTTGDKGSVEISELIFEVLGSAPGAKMIVWNSDASSQGANGLWDTHARIGGSAGSKLQSDTCTKTPNQSSPNTNCIGAHTLFHATSQASVLLENCWFWVADHELDLSDHNQVSIYSGRGVLLESQNPTWLYGTAAEHNIFYQYQLSNASNVYMGIIQTETPYYQPNPAPPYPMSSVGNDPVFSANTTSAAWGLRIVDSSDVLVYGAGLYSFFQNWDETCINPENCQAEMISIEGTADKVTLFGVSTKAATNMISTGAGGIVVQPGNSKIAAVQVLQTDNRNNFCSTVAKWTAQ